MEFYANMNAILSWLLIQVHYNDTLPYLSKCATKNCGRFYCDLTMKPPQPIQLSLLRWQFILGERTDKHLRKAILALKSII